MNFSDTRTPTIRRRKSNQETGPARPFFKWAGGKHQLLFEFMDRFPEDLTTGHLDRYVEPFVGGGAVFFHLSQNYPVRESVICDKNEELILTYRVVQRDVDALIDQLTRYQERYDLLSEPERAALFYQIRSELNANRIDFDFTTYGEGWIDRAAQLLFLNKTCFNGLFRLNQKGEFNVPFGKYKNPRIVNEPNLRKASGILSHTTILLGDFTRCTEYIDEKTFVYLDPPYRPLNKTSTFTSYSKEGFCDADQCRLSEFFSRIDATGARVMLSNSDPKNENPNDDFFDELYAAYTIERVLATRLINSVGEKRGAIYEIIVLNYQKPERSGGADKPKREYSF